MKDPGNEKGRHTLMLPLVHMCASMGQNTHDLKVRGAVVREFLLPLTSGNLTVADLHIIILESSAWDLQFGRALSCHDAPLTGFPPFPGLACSL